jgi:hypothetical protein
MNHRAVVLALLSAALFGLATPAAKVLIGSIHPAILAGLLYCGAGFGMAIYRRGIKPLIAREAATEAPLSAADMPWPAESLAHCC